MPLTRPCLSPPPCSLPACPACQPALPASCLAACLPAGLEVKVAFGGVWKESLSELSGGQKSLLALSLILAMLLFKPAPIYILDEVGGGCDVGGVGCWGNAVQQCGNCTRQVVPG